MAWGYLDQRFADIRKEFDPAYGEETARGELVKIVDAALGAEAAARITQRVVCDLPARALLEASDGFDLLVVGARGLGGFKGLLLGSVSQKCLQHSKIPIAVVRGVRVRPRAAGDERVVVGIDGSATSRRALRWARDEAAAREATLGVVHAWHIPAAAVSPYGWVAVESAPFSEAAQELLTTAVREEVGERAVAPVAPEVVEGPAAPVLLDAAVDADLVVVGSRGHGGFTGMLLGSVAQQVARHAPCPVVVVPPESRDAPRV
jgi:nucleotide-binding universal stress UspA family protein